MLSTISNLFSSTLDESLKKLVQPVGLVPAALLLLLHLVVTVPALSEAGDPLVADLQALDDLWKVALGLALLLALGYLIQAVTPSIEQVFTGEALGSQTWLVAQLRRRQERSFRRLCRRISASREEHSSHVDLVLERKARFPWVEGDEQRSIEMLAPTAFGNAWLAAAWEVWHAYGIDPTATWTQMRTALKDDVDLRTTVDGEMAAIDTLLNAAVVLVVFGTTAALAGARVGEYGLVPVAIIAIGVAYLVYRVATLRVRRWGDLTQAAYDLHRGRLATALGLSTGNADIPRSTWKEASTRLAWGLGLADLEAGKDPVTLTAVKALSVVCLPNQTIRTDDSADDVARLTIVRRYRVAIASATAPAGNATTAGTFFLSDARVPRVGSVSSSLRPEGTSTAVESTVVPGGGGVPDLVEWRVSGLPASVELVVDVGISRVIEAGVVDGPDAGEPTVQIERLSDAAPATYMIATTWDADAVPADTVLRLSDDGIRRANPTARWKPHHGDEAELDVMPDGAAAWRIKVPADLPDARRGRIEVTGADHD